MELLLLVVVCGLLITAADGNTPVKVESDSVVVLPCSLSSKENIESKLFDWKKDDHMEVFMYDGGLIYGNGHTGQDKQFEGRVSHFGDELKNGNASIKITKAKVSDSGNYSCIFPRLKPPQTFNIQLVVSTCPKPTAKVIKHTNDQAVLRCVVQGAFSKPKVEWRDSSGLMVDAEEPQVTDKGDIILLTTVTKSDNYSCVITQEEICHEIQDEILVSLPKPEPPGIPYGWIVAAVLAVVVLAFVVRYFKNKLEGRTEVPTGEHENKQKPGDQETHPVLHEL